jgi:hypothetical protein
MISGSDESPEIVAGWLMAVSPDTGSCGGGDGLRDGKGYRFCMWSMLSSQDRQSAFTQIRIEV